MRILVTAAVLMFALPAYAQFAPTNRPSGERWSGPRAADGRLPAPSVWRQVGEIDQRIDDGREARTLTRRDAWRLRREGGQIGTLAERYAADGLSDAEQRELDTRTAVLRAGVNNARIQGAARKR